MNSRLLWKYTHVGCPAARYEDICTHPAECADNGRCDEIEQPDVEPGTTDINGVCLMCGRFRPELWCEHCSFDQTGEP